MAPVFYHDALGRRTAKISSEKTTRYLWDGNVLLHEWSYPTEQRPQLQTSDLGEISYEKEPTENVTTWVYDEGSYTPIGKLINGERYSIISDYIGRPVQCFNDTGELIWETDYDIYGRLKNLKGDKYFIPFRQMGQYEDEELGGLYYNRFRYYDSWSGVYISQDPIGLNGGFNFYAYVHDSNGWVDVFGLVVAQIYNITAHAKQPTPRSPFQSHHIIQDEWAKSWAKNKGFSYCSKNAPSILLDATPGSNQHAIVTARQNARRNARVAAGKEKWSTSLEQELRYAKKDLTSAGVPRKETEKAMKETKNYFKSCR